MANPRFSGVFAALVLVLGLFSGRAQSQPDMAASLIGNDFFRTFTWSNELFPDENMSVECWFNAAAPGVIVSEVDTYTGSIWDHALAELMADGTIQVGFSGVPVVTTAAVQLNTWHQLTFAYNQTNDTLNVWLDGVSAGSSIGDRQTPTEATGRTYVICFGRSALSKFGAGTYLTGKFDEVRIWNVAIDADRVATTWNKTLTEMAPGLGALWHFDQANGAEAVDSRGVQPANTALHVPQTAFPLVLSTSPLSTAIVAITKPATVTNHVATLYGMANGRGKDTSVYFEWGTTTNYGNQTAGVSIGNTSNDILFSEILTNLVIGDYYFRAVAKSGTEMAFGADASFSVLEPAGYAGPLNGAVYFRTTQWSDAMFQTDDFTFELWFNASGPGILINEADNADPNAWDKAFAEVFPGGVIKAGVPGVATVIAGTVEFGTWHHLAITYNQANTTFSAYLDGALTASVIGDRISPRDVGRISVYCIGRGGQTNLGGGNWFTGQVDEAHIWKRALSAAELASGYNKVLATTIGADASLLANWHFDDVTPGAHWVSSDASGRNNPAWHVPDADGFPLVPSAAPLLPDQRPIFVSQSAQSAVPGAADIQVVINPRGLATDVLLEFGQSNVFEAPMSQQVLSETNVTVTWSRPNLAAGQTYQYRVTATNSAGVSSGPIGTVVVSGIAGTAFRLVQPDYLRITNNLSSQFPGKSITVELWFNPTKAGVLASETAFTPSYDRSILEILPSANVQAGFNGLIAISVGDANFNTWNHVALRYNETNQAMDAFLNGKKSVVRTGARVTPSQGIPEMFAFGRAATTKLGTGEYFGGDLDEIRIWNIARTDEDLSSARFNMLAGDEAGLVAYWRDGVMGAISAIILDASSHNNNGRDFGADVVVSTAPLVFNARRVGQNQFEAQFIIKGGMNYVLQGTEDFKTWTSIATNAAAPGGFIRFPLAIGLQEGGTFYRVVPQ